MAEIGQTDLAYLAGLIDGEGSITLGWRWTTKQKPKRYRYMQLRLDIANTDYGVLAWSRSAFSMPSVLYTSRRQRAHWKQAHHLVWSGQNAATVLQAVYPYLKVKKGQAETALKFQATKVRATRLGVPADVQEARDGMAASIRVANARGISGRGTV